jgi:hypothetical protein
MMVSARSELQTNFRAEQANGLRDMKFSLGKVSESTVEDVCVVVNRVLAAVDAGKAKTVTEWGDSNRP